MLTRDSYHVIDRCTAEGRGIALGRLVQALTGVLISGCLRCTGYTFCELHRLPEQHACMYDHKANGRQEARDKMVSPKKHVGTSLKRLDS